MQAYIAYQASTNEQKLDISQIDQQFAHQEQNRIANAQGVITENVYTTN